MKLNKKENTLDATFSIRLFETYIKYIYYLKHIGIIKSNMICNI